MKKINLLFTIIISLSIVFVSCSKDDDDDTVIPTINDTNGQGSYSFTLDGTTYSALQDEISLTNNYLLIPAKDSDGNGFNITIANVPNSGSGEILFENADETSIIISVFMADAVGYVGYSGTVNRTGTKTVEASGQLHGMFTTDIVDFDLSVEISTIINAK